MASVVMFVLNDARSDSRVMREADTLAAAGHAVTVIGRTTPAYAAEAEQERRASGVTIIRVPVAAGLRRWLLLGRRPALLVQALPQAADDRIRQGPGGWLQLALAAAAGLALVPVAAVVLALVVTVRLAAAALPNLQAAWLAVEWQLQWRFSVRIWARRAAAVAPAADVVHAHDLPALAAAWALPASVGRRLIYDSHEIFIEAGRNARRPARAKRAMRRLEQRLAVAAHVMTVNEELAAILGPALRVAEPVVVRNCPPRWAIPIPPPDLLRQALGLGRATPIVLYHGALVSGRGLAELAAAMRQPGLATAHLVYLGWGASTPEVTALVAAPEAGGRLHLLPPVPPDELLPWVASADVVAVTIQPDTLNHRLSTPNKLWEALAAGVPVVASDFPAMRHVVLDDPLGPLGVVCDPTDPVAIGQALRDLLERSPAERAALRARCHQAATERWNWEQEFAAVLRAYSDLTGRPW